MPRNPSPCFLAPTAPLAGAAAENLAYKSGGLIRLGITTAALETGGEDKGRSEFQMARAGKVFRDKPIHSSLFTPGHPAS